MSILFLVLDGLPPRHVGRRLTPALCGLAASGGWAPAGGRAVAPSLTYPNHATFVTGVGPDAHGLRANTLPAAAGPRRAWEVGPAVPTLFDACRAAGRHTAAVLGDQHLVAVMGAAGAGTHWPPGGELPAGTPTDVLGYAADDAVLGPLRAAVADAPDLLVAHLNAPDTAGHVHGPDSAEATAQYRATDAVLGLVLDALAPCWDDWLVIVVSDHDQEAVTVPEPVDLAAVLPAPVVTDGGAALVAGPPDVTAGIEAIDGVGGHRRVAEDLTLVWTAPGRWFGSHAIPVKGVHGSPRQAAQVAVCGGGHAAVGPLAARLRRGGPAATEWAGLIARVLGVPGAFDLTNGTFAT